MAFYENHTRSVSGLSEMPDEMVVARDWRSCDREYLRRVGEIAGRILSRQRGSETGRPSVERRDRNLARGGESEVGQVVARDERYGANDGGFVRCRIQHSRP